MYHIITVERQYASGGNEIGKRLAAELGYRLYDKNILVMAAAELEIPPIYIENLEETGPGSILLNLSRTALGGVLQESSDASRLSLTERLFLAEKKIVEEIVEQDNCIIIGRAAGFLLKDRTDCLNVFIHADTKKRLTRAVEREGIRPEDAESVLKKNDKRRREFYEYHTKRDWGNPSNFDLCLDSGSLGIETCTSILKETVSK